MTMMMRALHLPTKGFGEEHETSSCGGNRWWVKRLEQRDRFQKKTLQKWNESTRTNTTTGSDSSRSRSEATIAEEDNQSESSLSSARVLVGKRPASSSHEVVEEKSTGKDLNSIASFAQHKKDFASNSNNNSIEPAYGYSGESASSIVCEPHLICNNGATNLRHAGRLVMMGGASANTATGEQGHADALKIFQDHPPTDASSYRIIVDLHGVYLKDIFVSYAPDHKKLKISASRSFGKTRFFQRVFLVDTHQFNPKEMSAYLYKGQLTVIVPSLRKRHSTVDGAINVEANRVKSRKKEDEDEEHIWF